MDVIGFVIAAESVRIQTQEQIIVFAGSDSIAAWMEHSKWYSCESFMVCL
jgi:hypothetical protein